MFPIEIIEYTAYLYLIIWSEWPIIYIRNQKYSNDIVLKEPISNNIWILFLSDSHVETIFHLKTVDINLFYNEIIQAFTLDSLKEI